MRSPAPDQLASRSTDPQVAHTIAGEQQLFVLRQTARVGQKAQSNALPSWKKRLAALAYRPIRPRRVQLIQRELAKASATLSHRQGQSNISGHHHAHPERTG